MSEYELVDAFWSAHMAAATALVFYLSIVSGYLFIAYSVGRNLLRSQVAFINLLFVVFGTFTTWGTYIYFRAGTEYYRRIENLSLTDFLGIDQTLAPHKIVAVILVAGMIGCLKFMWDVRRARASN